MTALQDLVLYENLRAEAEARGFGPHVAAGVYAKRTGNPCPFHPVRSAPTTAASSATASSPTPSSSKASSATSVIDSSAPAAKASTSSPSGHSGGHPGTATTLSTPLCKIDWETRSECDLRACGAEVYAEHPSTEALCLAYRMPDGVRRLWTPEDGGCPKLLADHIAAGGLLGSLNVLFEIAIWEEVAVKRMGWPAVPLEQWRDTMAQSAAMAIPMSLEAGCAAMGVAVQKDMAGKAVMLKLSVPRRPTKADPSKWNNDPALFERLYAYCWQDVEAEHALAEALPPLSPHELEVWKASTRINRRGMYCDREAVAAALRMMDLAIAAYHRQVSTATGGIITGENLGSWQQVLPWMRGRGVNLPNYQKGTLGAVDLATVPKDVAAVIRARLATGRTSTAKYLAMRDRACADGRLRGMLTYHGANTGRWAGRGVQPQNLPRSSPDPEVMDQAFTDMATLSFEDFSLLWGDPLAMASACLRGALCAAPGKVLVAGDYSAIEARVCNWLAGQDDIVEIFRKKDRGEGPDAYRVMASRTFKVLIELVTYVMRQLGKAQELGCQFGCGWKTFKEVASQPPYNCVLTDEEAQAAVDLYRQTHPNVVNLWYALENAAIGAIRTGTVTVVRDGMIKFRMMGPHLKMRLPSGRLLTYPFAEIHPRMTPWGQMKDAVTFMAEVGEGHVWQRDHTYGGSLCENAVQAIARDLMADAILRAEARGFPVVLTVHDELVCEIDDTPISADAADLEAIMCELPSWAEGLPVAAEGFKGHRYRK